MQVWKITKIFSGIIKTLRAHLMQLKRFQNSEINSAKDYMVEVVMVKKLLSFLNDLPEALYGNAEGRSL